MGELYKPAFPVGSKVRVISRAALESFARDWKYHHKLQAEQMEYAGTTAVVKNVSFYHGGDQLYVLENVPGIWNEPCLESAKPYRGSDMRDEDVKNIEPRPLSEREAGWIRDILQVNDEWRDADISRTQVVAEGPCDEGISIRLQAPEPENPKAKPVESVGELWIQTEDGCSINVQLSQFEGQLRELYVLFIDPKHSKRELPESWTEVSREAVNM